DLDGEVAGPKARIEWRIDNILPAIPESRLTFEAEASYDEIREERFEVGVRLRIPLGGKSWGKELASLTPQERRMSEGLERDTDIVTSNTAVTTASDSVTEHVEDALTGVDFENVVVVDGAD